MMNYRLVIVRQPMGSNSPKHMQVGYTERACVYILGVIIENKRDFPKEICNEIKTMHYALIIGLYCGFLYLFPVS